MNVSKGDLAIVIGYPEGFSISSPNRKTCTVGEFRGNYFLEAGTLAGFDPVFLTDVWECHFPTSIENIQGDMINKVFIADQFLHKIAGPDIDIDETTETPIKDKLIGLV